MSEVIMGFDPGSAMGDETSVATVTQLPDGKLIIYDIQTSSLAKDKILFHLPGTQAEIAERADLRLATVCEWLSVLVARHEVHLAAWVNQPRGGKPIGVYALGGGPAAPRPAMSQNAERSKRSRIRRITLQ